MKGGLRFEGVGRTFEARRSIPALIEFTLACHRGQITSLLGPNGAGKSTALALVAGLLPATTGEILFAGSRVTPARPPARFGYLPQHAAFPATLLVREILDLAIAVRGSSRRQQDEVLTACGLDTVLERRVGELSSGWQRRLGLGLALLQPTDLVLLDEPFVGLDLATLERSLELLRAHRDEGAVVLLASHDFHVVDRLASRIAILDQGRLRLVQAFDGVNSRDLYQSTLLELSAPTQPPRVLEAAG
jgi:ABC-2 type transport system ATP-binding protein